MSRLVLAALLASLLAPSAAAQAERLAPDAPRVLFAVADEVKGDDGVRVRVVRTVTYDPVAGTYLDETVAADGRVLARRVDDASHAAPTPAEWALARRLVAAHPEVAPLVAAADAPVQIEGGFPLIREAGHPCGPGGRCVQVDVFATPAGGPAERLRYVVVDLRRLRVLDADVDPDAETNLAHPRARAESRRQ